MTEPFSTVLTASILLFMGGALTALGVERLYWSAKSGMVRMRKRKVLELDA